MIVSGGLFPQLCVGGVRWGGMWCRVELAEFREELISTPLNRIDGSETNSTSNQSTRRERMMENRINDTVPLDWMVLVSTVGLNLGPNLLSFPLVGVGMRHSTFPFQTRRPSKRNETMPNRQQTNTKQYNQTRRRQTRNTHP